MRHSYTATSNTTYGPHEHNGGPLTVQAKGTWSGATLSIQIDIGAGFTQTEVLTADDEIQLHAQAGAQVQYVLSGGGSPNIEIVGSN